MIAIRFDGPPGPESGRFIEVERDGASIKFGEWKQDGADWLLELTDYEKLREALQQIAEDPWSSALDNAYFCRKVLEEVQ